MLVSIIKIIAQLPPFEPTKGLVAWPPFAGNTNDLSGNGNNVTYNGATLTTDSYGNSNCAHSFNGWQGALSNSIQAPNKSLQDYFQFSGWYKTPYYNIVGITFLFANN